VAAGQIMWSAERDGSDQYMAWPLYVVNFRHF